MIHGNPLRYYFDLIVTLTQKELKVRYKRSFLGYLWSIANPLALALVFFVAFKVVMKIGIENYTLFLISGLFPWQWFANSINSSPMALLGNASLIKKVNFPREILIVVNVLNDMLHFILSIPVIVVFLIYYGMRPDLTWVVGIPLLLFIQFVMVCGFAMALAAINLFFRDLERLTFIITTLLFYLTPIIYSENMIPEKHRHLISLLNPTIPLFVSWRSLFLEGTLHFRLIAASLLYSVIIFLIGYAVFRRLKWKFAEVL
ncbi:MAG TPA: ABC transporter permease [Nitrospiraceae bacterium]|jgi:lipopolysaccharide transport system permease protein|nr:ABC transporter permease [Nitrospiraceae bacterium]